jgi:hypothetical protein
MAYSVGRGAAGGGAIGTGFSCVALNGRPGPGQVQSRTTLEEITLTPACGGAVSSESAGTVADADGTAVEVAAEGVAEAVEGAADEAAGWLVPPGCGVDGVQAVRASSSAIIPTPAFRALTWIFLVLTARMLTAPMTGSPRPCQPRDG